jgi:4-amino-4-deoxy-L-arabinose transferase-like glycosyltransferase
MYSISGAASLPVLKKMLRQLLKKYPLLFILSLAFLLRLIYFIVVILRNPEGIYVYDSYGYWQIAFNLREYGIFSQSYHFPIEPDYYRTPIYPLFIILSEAIGPEGFSIIALQVILAVATCYFTYRVAMEITGSAFISNIAALIITLDVPSIVMNTLVMTETLFTFLLLVCIFFFIRYLKVKNYKLLIISALFCGGTILCRPIGFFLPFFLSFFLFFSLKKEFKKVLFHVFTFCVIVFISVSPWLVRNKVVFGHYFLSVIREHNMQNYEAAAIYSELHGRSLAESQSILRWKTFREFKGDANAQPYEYAKYIESQAIDYTLENPAIYLKHHVKQFILFFLKPCRAYVDIQLGNWGSGYNTIPKDYPVFDYLFKHNSKFTIVLVLFQMFILLLMYPFILISFFYFRNTQKVFYFLFLVSIVCSMAILTLPAVAESRFRVPVMPLVAVLSASGIFMLKERFRNRQSMKK